MLPVGGGGMKPEFGFGGNWNRDACGSENVTDSMPIVTVWVSMEVTVRLSGKSREFGNGKCGGGSAVLQRKNKKIPNAFPAK